MLSIRPSNPHILNGMPVIEASARTGAGFSSWTRFLEQRAAEALEQHVV
jgi:hypothetical protein